MPEAFDKCVAAGGRIRTKSMGNGKYKHVCYLGKKAYSGYIKTKKSNKYTQALKG
jgi:hypothetical protein